MGFWDATNDCIHYIDKVAAFGTNGTLVISASAGRYANTNYLLDDIRHGEGYGPVYSNRTDVDYSSYGSVVWSATNGLYAAGVPSSAIVFSNGTELCLESDASSNCVRNTTLPHPNGATNLAGYMCWGGHSSLGGDYPRDGTLVWGTNCAWWIIETLESSNGDRRGVGVAGTFQQWFSDEGFGAQTYTHYENTPVGAVTHTDEPLLTGMEDASVYFGLWASGKTFAICAWKSRRTPFFQAVGDPFVRR